MGNLFQRVHRHFTPAGLKASATLTIKYDIKNTASNTLTVKYDIFQLATALLTLKYDIFELISNSLTLKYDISGFVNNTLTLVYDVLTGTATASEKPATPHGIQMPKIDEFDLPERTAKITEVKIPITAAFICPEAVDLPLSARLKTEVGQNLPIASDSLKKVEKVLSVEARIRSEIQKPIKIEAKLKAPQKTVQAEAKLSFIPILRQIHSNLETLLGGKFQSFEITAKEWGPQIIAGFEEILSFKEPSSVVGLVTYDTESGIMSIFLGGNNRYDYKVPARIFDGFRGAPSKGAYYNRNIKGQYPRV